METFTVDGARPHTIDLQTVGGYAVFDVASKTGEPMLTIEYACHPNGLTGKGDFQRETSARYLGEKFDLPVLPCGRAASRRSRIATPGSAREAA